MPKKNDPQDAPETKKPAPVVGVPADGRALLVALMNDYKCGCGPSKDQEILYNLQAILDAYDAA
jgi:hypothetical protein